jgi:hypothetical protein
MVAPLIKAFLQIDVNLGHGDFVVVVNVEEQQALFRPGFDFRERDLAVGIRVDLLEHLGIAGEGGFNG